MLLKSEDVVMKAMHPSQVFSMNLDTLEEEREAYLTKFKPAAYSTIKNFILTQRITLLYREAIEILKNNNSSSYYICFEDTQGQKRYEGKYHYSYDIKFGTMYVTDKNIVFYVLGKYEKYYENFLEKTRKFPKLDKDNWEKVMYMLPNVKDSFTSTTGDKIIIVEKPCEIYPLKEILNYFGGRLNPEYVASIITRLNHFICYIDICYLHHNGITLDNLFFAPGRVVKKGEPYTVNDMRIVGVYGGWFFTTWNEEKISGMPRDIYEYLPDNVKRTGYSSFEIDVLSIKKLALELLGGDLTDVPEAFVNWINCTECAANAYEEYKHWEDVIIRSFGKKRFVQMDISI